MKPNSTQMSIIYDDWKVAVNDILDVEGLFPTFVMNILSKSSLSVAKNNGIGNTWGLDDEQDLISKFGPRTSIYPDEIPKLDANLYLSLAAIVRMGPRRRRYSNDQLG